MNLLRWILAAGMVLFCAAWGIFFVIGNNLRRSFGASENHALLAVIPIAFGLVIAWLLIPIKAQDPRRVTPEGVKYPVIWLNQDQVSFCAVNPQELTLFATTNLDAEEKSPAVVDATGRRYLVRHSRYVPDQKSAKDSTAETDGNGRGESSFSIHLISDQMLGLGEIHTLLSSSRTGLTNTTNRRSVISDWFLDYRARQSQIPNEKAEPNNP